MDSKYLILIRIAVVGCGLLILWLIFKPPASIPSLLFDAKNIDSIQIIKSDSVTTLNDVDKISKVCRQFKKLIPTDLKMPKATTGIMHMYVYTKNKEIPIVIFYTRYDGIVVDVNNQDYKNDSLNIVIESYRKSKVSVIVN